jgi:hypothetical protein
MTKFHPQIEDKCVSDKFGINDQLLRQKGQENQYCT